MSILDISNKLAVAGVKHIVVHAAAASIPMSDAVKHGFELYKQELAELAKKFHELEPEHYRDDVLSKVEYVDKQKYLGFLDDRSWRVYLDKATGMMYESKSGPAPDLKRSIGLITNPKARKYAAGRHVYVIGANGLDR